MYLIFKRLLDIVLSIPVLIIGFPFFLIISIWIFLESKGGIFYSQKRIGKNGTPFNILKFRTMYVDSDKVSRITVGNQDPRVTKSGRWIRKYKIDEFPQLINVIKGEMSIVGPRPEVEEYVKLYTDEQKNVLSLKPGLTDYASIAYINENEILSESENPHETYVQQIMPEKLKLNLKYISDISFGTDLKIIFRTIFKIFR